MSLPGWVRVWTGQRAPVPEAAPPGAGLPWTPTPRQSSPRCQPAPQTHRTCVNLHLRATSQKALEDHPQGTHPLPEMLASQEKGPGTMKMTWHSHI